MMTDCKQSVNFLQKAIAGGEDVCIDFGQVQLGAALKQGELAHPEQRVLVVDYGRGWFYLLSLVGKAKGFGDYIHYEDCRPKQTSKGCRYSAVIICSLPCNPKDILQSTQAVSSCRIFHKSIAERTKHKPLKEFLQGLLACPEEVANCA